MNRIHDSLALYFGPRTFFRDVDDLRGGESFQERLTDELRDCTLALVVVGTTWETCEVEGKKRLSLKQDVVRSELRELLRLQKRLIPVLVDRDSVPAKTAVPAELRSVFDFQAVRINTGKAFDGGVKQLAERISELTGFSFLEYGRLLQQCRDVGLSAIWDNFQLDRLAINEITNAESLLVVQNDGAAWVESNQELLKRRLGDDSKTTKIMLYHPQSKFLKILDQKNGKGLDRQIGEIRNSFMLLTSFVKHEMNFEIRAHHGFNPYSLILTENYAFMDPYFLNRRGALPRLVFTSQAEQGLYQALRLDAETLFAKSPILNAASFEKRRRKTT